ncbi:hypothetical protein STEG23_001982, partial [Scotinomys teguina]
SVKNSIGILMRTTLNMSTALARTLSNMLNRYAESGNPFLVPDFSGIPLSFSPFNLILAVRVDGAENSLITSEKMAEKQDKKLAVCYCPTGSLLLQASSNPFRLSKKLQVSRLESAQNEYWIQAAML